MKIKKEDKTPQLWQKTSLGEWIAGHCRTIQLAVWTAFILFQMAVLCQLEIHASEHENIQEDMIGEDVPYERYVEENVTYRGLPGENDIPETITLQVVDGDQETTATCSLMGIISQEELWEEDFSLPVIFRDYEADFYLFNGMEIPRNDTQPELSGHEEEIISEAGLSSEDYRVTNICWDGAVYTDPEGVSCRNALVLGKRRLWAFQVKYGGTAVFDALPSYLAGQEELTFETEDPMPPAERGSYAISTPSEAAQETEMEQEAEPEQKSSQRPKSEPETEGAPEVEEAPEEKTLWEKITQCLYWALGLGTALVFLGILCLFIIYIAKKMHMWYDKWKEKQGGK